MQMKKISLIILALMALVLAYYFGRCRQNVIFVNDNLAYSMMYECELV